MWMNLLYRLIRFFVHPIVLGSGLPLFTNMKDSMDLRHVKAKTPDSGVVMLYYVPTDKRVVN